ncbi:DUF6362 family protein [Hoeflea sp. TYP-13]|uniref:DUF6362 family protein n=1 Tax=Hoeflea sp. TYP-13 TaxID=3230023 RepID=UPI0034C62145
MTPVPEFQDWTAKAVEHRLIEAAETLTLCPRALGPKAYGNSMPEPLRRQSDAYASNAPRYRRRPSAGAMDRMEICWTWINALDEKQDRQLLYDWARAKGGRGRSLKVLAMEEGMSDRTLRREITRICKTIARRLNRQHTPQHSEAINDEPHNAHQADETVAPNRTHDTHWRAHNARPVIDSAQPQSRTIPR